MKRLTVEFDDADYSYLQERAKREGTSLVSILREAVASLRRTDRLDPRSDPMYPVGSFEGPTDLAEKHDEYLYGPQ